MKKTSALIGVIIIIVAAILIGGIFVYKYSAAPAAYNPANVVLPKGSEQTAICTLIQDNSLVPGYFSEGLDYIASGKNCATVERSDAGGRFNINGKITKYYQGINYLNAVFSSDGKHFSFVVNPPLKSYLLADHDPDFVVIDGVEGKKYSDIFGGIQYSSDDKVGYCAKDVGNNNCLEVIDGKEQIIGQEKPGYNCNCGNIFGEEAKNIIVSSQDSSLNGEFSLASDCQPPGDLRCLSITKNYITLKDKNNSSKKIYGGYANDTSGMDQYSGIHFSPDSKNFVFIDAFGLYGGSKPKFNSVVVLNGKIIGNYDEVVNINFSADSKYLFYNARKGNIVYYINVPLNVI